MSHIISIETNILIKMQSQQLVFIDKINLQAYVQHEKNWADL